MGFVLPMHKFGNIIHLFIMISSVLQTLFLTLGTRTANCQSIHTMPTLTKIKESIPSTPVVMVSKSYCPFCRKAKDALKSFNLGSDLVVYEIENDSDMDAIQNEMAKMTGGRSVPRVFIGGQFVGGGDEMVKYKSNGKLAELIYNARSG